MRHMNEPPFISDTRTSYDVVAGDYAVLIGTDIRPGREADLDLGMIAEFARRVGADGGGLVLDAGCGPGRMTAHLHGLGVDVFGVDLSPAMIAVARKAHPALRFEVGTITALDLPDGALRGLLAWYSIIHIPPEIRAVVFAEFSRVLAPGGHLLLAFHVGDEPRQMTMAYGHPVSMVSYRLDPDQIGAVAEQAGLSVSARLVREPEGREQVSQCTMLLRNHNAPAEER